MYCYSFRKNVVMVLELNFDFTEVNFFRKYVMISLQKKKEKKLRFLATPLITNVRRQ